MFMAHAFFRPSCVKYESDEILSCDCRHTAGDWCGDLMVNLVSKVSLHPALREPGNDFALRLAR